MVDYEERAGKRRVRRESGSTLSMNSAERERESDDDSMSDDDDDDEYRR
jgi:hypothetical protein